MGVLTCFLSKQEERKCDSLAELRRKMWKCETCTNEVRKMWTCKKRFSHMCLLFSVRHVAHSSILSIVSGFPLLGCWEIHKSATGCLASSCWTRGEEVYYESICTSAEPLALRVHPCLAYVRLVIFTNSKNHTNSKDFGHDAQTSYAVIRSCWTRRSNALWVHIVFERTSSSSYRIKRWMYMAVSI